MYAPVTRSCWDTPSLCSRSVAIFSPSETSWPSLITTYTQKYKSFYQPCTSLACPHTLWLRKTRLAPVTHFSLPGQTLSHASLTCETVIHFTSSSRKSPRFWTLSMCILVCPTRNSRLVFFTKPAETKLQNCFSSAPPTIATRPSSAQKLNLV